MRYKCLVLDHDDTVVKSTPEIHYPSFVEAMRVLRPGERQLTLDEFIRYSCDPGTLALLRDVIGLNDQEMILEQEIWRKYTRVVVPKMYEGFDVLLDRFREAGGRVCVVSHSESDNIRRHYRTLFGFEPDMVFGWEMPEHQRKPQPYPLDAIMRAYGLTAAELLMVDDLPPGMDMARSRGVDFAWAAWSHTMPCASAYMRTAADYRFDTVDAFRRFIFSEEA